MTVFTSLLLAMALVAWVGIFGFAVINAALPGGIFDFRRKGGWDAENALPEKV